MPSNGVDVVVVGGGIAGLASSWKARLRGMSVVVVERDEVGRGASNVAAGMLAPVAEAEFGEAGRRALELGVRSAGMWPAFAAELGEASGIDVGFRRSGTLMVAGDGDQARELERQAALRDSLGAHVERLMPSQARALEPALAPVVRMAVHAPEDHSVDPRLAMRALALACRDGGVQVREGAEVRRVLIDRASTRVEGVELASGERIGAEAVVIAAGAWSGTIEGLGSVDLKVRPVKGQILRLRDPRGPGLLERVVRFEGGYLVPRNDGGYVLGATVEERGFDEHATAGGVYELLRDAHDVVPGVSELRIEEIGVGFRPGTPDNHPLIGACEVEGLVLATGHHRNGILLAPVTAQAVSSALQARRPRETAGEAVA